MNENIDLTKILYGCPEGTKFYSTIFGEVSFVGICLSSSYPIKVKAHNKHDGTTINEPFTIDGKYAESYDGECTLFPSKEQRDWSKFERFWDKPKIKKFDMNTLQPFDKVLVRDSLFTHWQIDFFGYINNRKKLVGCSTYWNMGIPYNGETIHLVGTRKDCPEYYKWWEE